MSLPQFAPFPDAKVRRGILPDEWELYLDSWVSLSDFYLRLKDTEFQSALDDEQSLTTFLMSFFHELAHDAALTAEVLSLRKKCFFLLHRILSGDETPPRLLTWTVLSDISRVFPKSEQFRSLLHSVWIRKGPAIEKTLQLAKTSLIKNLDSNRPEDTESTLDRLAPLLRVSTDASTYMLTGSDFLDTVISVFPNLPSNMKKKLVTIIYLGIYAILEGPKPNFSLLSDHLYSLKSSGEIEQKKGALDKSFVADLVTNSPLLDKIRDRAIAAEATRAKNTAALLSAFRQSSIARPKKLVRRKVDKGKGKQVNDEYGHESFGEIHIHRMSLISQIQDLFPDLGAGFVVKLLDEYNENVEQITSHLLEDSLPAHLASSDRSEPLPTAPTEPAPHLPPRSTPPPERRNVFDDDEFDKLAIDTSRLHIGRRNEQLTADKILSDRQKAPTKSAILSALAAFDSDDDERDDTYDVEDVGGTVDSAAPGADEVDADVRDKNDEALFRAYTSTPELFGRDTETRRGKARAALKSETNMTDEAIEGWAIMIIRDPRRLRRLEAKFSTWTGQQTELPSTAYRGSPADSSGEADSQGQRGGRGGSSNRGRGRGRGRGGGGRGGGNVAGPTGDKGTQDSRQRKEANKGSRANHNRREQRAKKMARGGFAG